MVSLVSFDNHGMQTQDSTTIASGIATIGTGYLVLTSESGGLNPRLMELADR